MRTPDKFISDLKRIASPEQYTALLIYSEVWGLANTEYDVKSDAYFINFDEVSPGARAGLKKILDSFEKYNSGLAYSACVTKEPGYTKILVPVCAGYDCKWSVLNRHSYLTDLVVNLPERLEVSSSLVSGRIISFEDDNEDSLTTGLAEIKVFDSVPAYNDKFLRMLKNLNDIRSKLQKQMESNKNASEKWLSAANKLLKNIEKCQRNQ